jgi:hypothetical protein
MARRRAGHPVEIATPMPVDTPASANSSNSSRYHLGGPLLRAMTILESGDEQQGFRGGQPQIEITQIWRTKFTPFPL